MTASVDREEAEVFKRTGPVLIAHYQASRSRRMTESRAGFGLTLVEITRKLWQQHVVAQMRLPFTEPHRRSEDHKMSDGADDLPVPVKQGHPASAIPPRSADPPWPGATSSPGLKSPRERNNEVDRRTLVIGQGISLSGEVASCDRLVVEGGIKAKLQNCQNVMISETGVFEGQASTENADVRGRFEGELAVRKRLLIRAGGHVSGTITYGELEIESGGKISGSIQEFVAADVVSNLRHARA
jgi:cytoskeletal protein CcmA (bactofilin family)